MSPNPVRRTTVLLLALLLSLPCAALSQSALEEAAALRDRRDFAAAAALLRGHLERAPGDAAAARMLAQTLYWMGDVAGARAEYEAALARTAGDPHLRLDYARLQAETGEHAHARELLLALRGSAHEVEAEALLGRIAYWSGDLTRAARHFRTVLRDVPDHADARRQLAEIRAATAPWVAVGAGYRADDQPLRRARLGVEAGVFPAALQRLTVFGGPAHYDAAGGTTAVAAGAALHSGWPAVRLETELGAGSVRHDAAPRTDWTGLAALALRLGDHARGRVSAERSVYDWTLASVAGAPLLTDAATARVEWARPTGWSAEAAATARRFPDGNRVTSTYLWALAPLVSRGGARLSAGYAFGAADADESRFVYPADPALPGRYTPYHTPDAQRVHSVIGALALPLGGAATLRTNGAYGVHASERIPLRGTPGDAATGASFERRFTPWNLRGTVAAAAFAGASLELSAEHARTAHYEVTFGEARMTYRLRRR